MQSSQPAILLQVERAREELHQTQKRYGFFTHPKVIEQSMILDELLNQYQRKRLVN
ncbi:aspartyl-phosphate phosphatase Spo0E family protein [Bacillus sp. FJAT-27264]|uniref:aspartyl-phosphate phosphatase Spo0E family protein n=1 Tax=Paenibacillus sp. (strain DSM 101736 / FJAT-27264) TaxID=1850362 RepID=UPI0009F72A5D|nr:aspartyl-phosphate phosphatase Spo0E family protein [Bacillus sp. FJAT-27264]